MGKLLFSGSALLLAGAFLLVACCVFACAGGLVFGLAGSYENDAQEIEELAEYSAGSLNDKVYATGTISDSATISSDPVLGDISQYELIGYQVDRWDVSRSSSSSSNRSTSYNGDWSDVSSAFGPFGLDNGEINVLPNDTVTIDGDVHEYLIPGTDGNSRSDTYNGQQVEDGTLRLQGFQNGDLITVMGIRRDGENLNAEKMYGGTRAEWVADLEGQAETSRNVGYVVAACGMCFLLPAIVIAAASIFGRRLFKSSSDTGAGMVNPTAMPYSPFPSGQSSTPSPFDSAAGPFGGPPVTPPSATPTTPPVSNIPSGNFWSDSSQPSGSSSPFDPPKEGSNSPFDPPKE